MSETRNQMLARNRCSYDADATSQHSGNDDDLQELSSQSDLREETQWAEAEQWAAELTSAFMKEEADAKARKDLARSRSPKRTKLQAKYPVNPWAKPSCEDLLMLKTPDHLVQALHVWNAKVNAVSRLPKTDLVVTFEPSPAVASESHLHQKIAAMGVDVFPKGSTPISVPYGLQGGQAGQYSVALVFCKDPLIKVTVQMQRAKGNVAIKGKRSMFETCVIMMLLPVFGAPCSVTAKQPESSKSKAASKENAVPIAKAFGRQQHLSFWGMGSNWALRLVWLGLEHVWLSWLKNLVTAQCHNTWR